MSENLQDASYVIFGIASEEQSDRNSTPESRSGKVQTLDEREQKLSMREAMIERRFVELKDREKKLSAREASLEAKLNRYFLCHPYGYRRIRVGSDDRLAFRKSASPGQS